MNLPSKMAHRPDAELLDLHERVRRNEISYLAIARAAGTTVTDVRTHIRAVLERRRVEAGRLDGEGVSAPRSPIRPGAFDPEVTL